MIRMLLKSKFILGLSLMGSFVHNTLKNVGKDMKGQEFAEEDVEEQVS